jgi:glutamate synthase (ferredoxin)
VLDEADDFHRRCNRQMVYLERLEDPTEVDEVEAMIRRHLHHTGSHLAQRVLDSWSALVPKFVKVMPKDYKRMLQAFEQVESTGLSGEEAVMTAFEMNKNDQARVSGN